MSALPRAVCSDKALAIHLISLVFLLCYRNKRANPFTVIFGKKQDCLQLLSILFSCRNILTHHLLTDGANTRGAVESMVRSLEAKGEHPLVILPEKVASEIPAAVYR